MEIIRCLSLRCSFLNICLSFIIVLMTDEVQADPSYAHLSATDGNRTHMVCVTYLPDLDQIPSREGQMTTPHILVELTHIYGCDPTDFENLPFSLRNSTVALADGNCTWVDKAKSVQKMNGSSILVVDKADTRIYLSSNKTENRSEAVHEDLIPAAFIALKDYTFVTASLHRPIEVRLSAWQLKCDPAPFLLILCSALIAVVASALSSPEGRVRLPYSSSGQTVNNKTCGTIKFALIIGFLALMAIPAVLSIAFFKTTVHVFILTFIFVTTVTLFCCLYSALRIVVSCGRVPFLEDPYACTEGAFALAISTALSMAWGLSRHSGYAWILQDILLASFCIACIFYIRPSRLTIFTLVFILLLTFHLLYMMSTVNYYPGVFQIPEMPAYDSSQSMEFNPWIFRVPFSSLSRPICGRLAYTYLGITDIIMPGILLAYNASFDAAVSNGRAFYFYTAIVAYAVSIGTHRFTAYPDCNQGPLMIYAVPIILLSSTLVACIRRQVPAYLFGQCATTDCDCDSSGPCSGSVHERDEWDVISSSEKQVKTRQYQRYGSMVGPV